jgi:hypothetical protein
MLQCVSRNLPQVPSRDGVWLEETMHSSIQYGIK